MSSARTRGAQQVQLEAFQMVAWLGRDEAALPIASAWSRPAALLRQSVDLDLGLS